MKKTIMLVGVHGSGKTYLLSHLKYKSFTASDLIKKYQNEITDIHKKVSNIQGNQNALLMAIEDQKLLGERFILDGHCCLLNEDGRTQKIDRDIFLSISIGGIIGISQEPQIIYDRLKQRDSLDFDINMISKFQKEELSYAKELSIWLKIPYIEAENNIESIKAFIDNIWGREM